MKLPLLNLIDFIKYIDKSLICRVLNCLLQCIVGVQHNRHPVIEVKSCEKNYAEVIGVNCKMNCPCCMPKPTL